MIHKLAARLGLLHKLKFRRESDDHHWIGEYGEKVVASWLRARGHRILRQNFRRRGGGEIDIVSRQDDELVFTEVKTRQTREGGAPARAVDKQKRDQIRSAARVWLNLLDGRDDGEVPHRFDIVEVILKEGSPPQLRELDDIFRWREGEARAR